MRVLRGDRDATGSPTRGGDASAPGTLDALALLEKLGTAVVCVRPDETVALVNAAAAAALGERARSSVGASFWDALPMLHDEHADVVIRKTARDGRPRSYRIALPGGRADAAHDVRVSRVEAGWLVFELRDQPPSPAPPRRGRRTPAAALAAIADDRARLAEELEERREENSSLRVLARRMAEVPDSATLLHILCEIVLAWCGADGAGVGQIIGEEGGIILTTAGTGAPEAGVSFPLVGSLAERALAERRIVSEPDYAGTSGYMRDWERRADVGEMVVAPLFAGREAVGILNAWRRRGAAPFTAEECERLHVIADHAAVALAKTRLLEEAHAASVARSNFLAAVSHELRTPLTTLAGYGELLADDILGPLTTGQHETIERMRSVTHQLSALIDEILTYSSLEAGCELVRASETTSEEVFTTAVAAVEPLVRQKGLALTTLLPPVPTPMYTDADKVRQILVNLIGNAVKFTDRGGVHLAVEVLDDRVFFHVRDTGIGIAKPDQQRLFLPFSQLDASLTRRHGGTGLGLYISRRLANLLGGRIEVTSEPGAGSLFTLVVPARLPRH